MIKKGNALDLTGIGKTPNKNSMKRYPYTIQQIQFLRDNAAWKTNVELTALFNKRFRIKKSVSAIFGAKHRYGIYGGISGWNGYRLKPGHIPWNKGKSTFVPKGEKAPAALPIGTERETSNGYVMVKISYHRQPSNKNWVYKHKLIWEAENGMLPKGYVVIFADKNKKNFALDNLIAVSKAVCGVMNKNRLRAIDSELTIVGKAIVELQLAITKRMRDI